MPAVAHRTRPGTPKALLFDMDGTVAETEECHRRAFNAAFAERGLDWHWSREEYSELLRVTGGKERIRRFLADEQPSLLATPDVDAFICGLHRDKTRHYVEAVTGGHVELRPGVARLVDEARSAGMKTAIVSTTSRANVDAFLASVSGADVRDSFDVICCAEDAPRKKPAPDAYLWTLAQLELPATTCLAIEDSEAGVRAAGGAGVPVLVTTSLYTTGHDFAGSLAVLSDLGTPKRPFRILRGASIEPGVVDLALLRRLVQAE